MARGKIKIKKIENQTNRQATYSRRRKGLFKKAGELAVLCDATVSIIMISGAGKLHEFFTPGITTKKIYDRFQVILGVDVWAKQYQKMEKELQNYSDINRELQKDIRQRKGDLLEGLSIHELHNLEQEIQNSVKVIRERKAEKRKGILVYRRNGKRAEVANITKGNE